MTHIQYEIELTEQVEAQGVLHDAEWIAQLSKSEEVPVALSAHAFGQISEAFATLGTGDSEDAQRLMGQFDVKPLS